ncbi:hypothetical protein CRI94_16840 [Longibacter salinarum]|uniref:PepSY domain-containing protein n=1 Tax=Longibacter salinarum TaxID=1850348 RepID=A0A2A8CTI2_9BACT|nr:hypothetical protein [Longibacter salinarum]PEN11087.1 hypothetical protein CRI94_16840 [Longibacter salinarum]
MRDLVSELVPLSFADDSLSSPRAVVSALSERHGEVDLHSLELRSLFDEPIYEVTYYAGNETHVAIADARTGGLRQPLAEKEAVRLARADFTPDVPVRRVDRLDTAPEGSEYRGVTLPAYRVVFDHPSDTRIYVSADRARVEARRNNTWRWFDGLWMLHIMDYDARSDFNHLLCRPSPSLVLSPSPADFCLEASRHPG